MRPPEAPHRRVVRAGGRVGGVEIAEAVRIPRNRISAEKPPEGRARTPRYPQASWRHGGMVAQGRRGEKERGESGGKAQSGGRALDFIKRAGRRVPKLAHARPLFPCCYIYFILNI